MFYNLGAKVTKNTGIICRFCIKNRHVSTSNGRMPIL